MKKMILDDVGIEPGLGSGFVGDIAARSLNRGLGRGSHRAKYFSFTRTGLKDRSFSTSGGRISRTLSISISVVDRPSVKRMDPWATSKGTPRARMTWLGSSEALAQAEPVEAKIPWASR